MKRASLFLVLALVAGCGSSAKPRSLLNVDITAAPEVGTISGVQIVITQGADAVTDQVFAWTAMAGQPMKVGLYLPDSVDGSIDVQANAHDGSGTLIGTSAKQSATVHAGEASAVVSVRIERKIDVGDGGVSPDMAAPGDGPLPDGAAPGPDAAAPSADASTTPPVSGEAPYGCSGCRRLFDGKSLDGWVTVPGAWEIKEGALASTGKANDIFTKEDIGDARIFFQVRQIKGDHKPCTTLFGNRPAGTSGSRGLSGAQFQPPNGAFWNYGVGGTFKRLVNPNFDVTKWHQCEIVIKEAGSFRAACCPFDAATPCKGVEVLQWTGKGKKFPFDIMMHNGGLFDEYREIWIEPSPKEDGFLSQK
ncbi:MAG TPA: family 16 glycoside hydrolase [Polyangia bacterium]|nr:family 16 glycoside hydrolase [Polyangia bacterium]